MSKVLDIYTKDGLKVTLNLRLSSDGQPKLDISLGLGIVVSAFCRDVELVTFTRLPDEAFLEMPGCNVMFHSDFLADVERLLDKAEGMAAA